MLLGLDLGPNLGWVLGDAVGPLRRGTISLENTTDLGRFLRSADWPLQQLLPRATMIGVEQPFMGDNYYAARKLLGLLGHVYYWANFVGIGNKQIIEVPVSTGKLTLAGHGFADKDRMMAAAAERGYPDLDEHQADALGIWWVVMFGARQAIRPARSRSSKARIITP